MMRLALVLAVVFAVGCKKETKSEDKPKPAATVNTGTKGADGVRTVAVKADGNGYTPDRIPGKPGEKLKLEFTRTLEGECLSKLKTPDGTLVDLPMNKPVAIDITVPDSGELKFACGMDMFSGVIVAEKS